VRCMNRSNTKAILCPNCRLLISLDEERCPHCGLRNPGSRWKNLSIASGLLGPERIITNIIAVNVVLFILSILLSILLNPGSIGFSMNPLYFLSPGQASLFILGETGSYAIVYYHRWWTLLSAGWLHASILHILFNMMALRQIGPLIVQEYGAYRMFSIYTLSGALGFLVSYLWGIPYTIGASASICGLIGAALYFGKSRGGQYGQMVYKQVSVWVISIFVFGLLIPGINNWAHGGGLVGGVLAGFLLGYDEKNPETYHHKLLAAICVLATLAALIASPLIGIRFPWQH